ncbi:hypothetical protein ACHAXN_012988 [Cyclotella atomus]
MPQSRNRNNRQMRHSQIPLLYRRQTQHLLQ